MATNLFLIGGGTNEDATCDHFAEFLGACQPSRPRIACMLIDEGDGSSEYFERFANLLRRAGDCEPTPVAVPVGGRFDLGSLDRADALLVCGGLTPAYAAAMAPLAAPIRDWLAAADRPYAGFSAGAAIAATRAIVGGWLLDGVPICPADTAEDLAELSVVDGLGLLSFAVEVHCGRWGTLSRLVAAVSSGNVRVGIGLDEDTMLTVQDGAAKVSGRGQAWLVSSSGQQQVGVQIVRSGGGVELAQT